jgi:ATP-binding cassette subfamily B protein/subfamily B ATP-binding cassette protein MsbA
MFLIYMLMLFDPLAVLAESAASFQDGMSALDYVLDLLAEPEEMISARGGQVVRKEDVRGRLTLENVGFCYPGAERPALRNIELDVEPHTMVALVGPSGAGKTTLCNLVARFYDPSEGRILLDGVDLRDFDVQSYRRLLGVVEQDVFLFDGTVAENIAYSDRSADGDAIRRAAQVANAEEFISQLPEGYETRVGERAVKLSGGQRQRLAIARAVLADPRILILDEATSNLDTQSERLIRESLRSLTAGRTTFVIAHRLSTIAHADLIVVLEQGSIREVGTHARLLRADSKYREMVQDQITLLSGRTESESPARAGLWT